MRNKIPLLLIPGLACTADLFADQIRSLQGERELYVADHCGHDNFEDLGRSILENAPPKFALAGLSMGGYLAFELLRQAPERVLGLALLDTSARADTAEKVEERKRAIQLAQTAGLQRVQSATLPFLIARARFGDAALKDRILGMAQDTGVEAWTRQMTALMTRPSSLGDLARIACPTWIFVGDDDRLTPLDCAEEMAAATPHAKLNVLEDCGHLSSMEQPERVTELLRAWLADCQNYSKLPD